MSLQLLFRPCFHSSGSTAWRMPAHRSLGTFKFKVDHSPGGQMALEDFLSRRPDLSSGGMSQVLVCATVWTLEKWVVRIWQQVFCVSLSNGKDKESGDKSHSRESWAMCAPWKASEKECLLKNHLSTIRVAEDQMVPFIWSIPHIISFTDTLLLLLVLLWGGTVA